MILFLKKTVKIYLNELLLNVLKNNLRTKQITKKKKTRPKQPENERWYRNKDARVLSGARN